MPIGMGWTPVFESNTHFTLENSNLTHADIGVYRLTVSTPDFSNTRYKSATISTTLDVYGKYFHVYCKFNI